MLQGTRRLGIATILIAGCGWLAIVYDTFSLPDVTPLKYTAPAVSAVMDDQIRRQPIRLHHVWVPDAQIADVLKRAVVAAEDDEFFHHPGFNWKAIELAWKLNWRRRRIVRGASTITQQLAKNLYLSQARTPTRKLKEFLIALKLERELSKERILELYLNFAEWGPGIYGCEAAAQYYFNGHCRRLTASQGAFLAAILPNPKKLGRGGYRLTHRAQQILQRM